MNMIRRKIEAKAKDEKERIPVVNNNGRTQQPGITVCVMNKIGITVTLSS
jgi:hypothetical protein